MKWFTTRVTTGFAWNSVWHPREERLKAQDANPSLPYYLNTKKSLAPEEMIKDGILLAIIPQEPDPSKKGLALGVLALHQEQ